MIWYKDIKFLTYNSLLLSFYFLINEKMYINFCYVLFERIVVNKIESDLIK